MKSSWAAGELSTDDLLDVLEGFGLAEGLRPLVPPDGLVLGPARTVWCPPGENRGVREAIDAARPGEMLVVASGPGSALLGGVVYRRAVDAGLVGIVVDGFVRDLPDLLDGPVPVACRGVDPRRPRKNADALHGVPIALGGCPVLPGDIVAVDADGVVRVPAGDAEQVVLAAVAAARAERGL
jgi:regulator of RNase E activity RraA